MKPESALQHAPREIYRRLTDQLAGVVAQEFFDQAVRALAFSLDAEYAFITQRDAGDPEQLRVIAAWQVNRLASGGLRLALKQTPAADTLLKRQLWYEDGVAARYPHDTWLHKHGVRGYGAVAIPGLDGTAIGHLGIMCRQSLQADDELFAVLHMLARRASAELRRVRSNPAADAPLRSEEKYRMLVDLNQDGVFLSQGGSYVYANRALTRMLAYHDHELLGIPVASTFAPADGDLGLQISTDTAVPQGTRLHEVQLRRKHGHSTTTVSITVSPVSWRGQPATMGTVRDISERKQIEQALVRSAYYDALTGLPNRTFFLERLNRMLRSANADADRKFAVLFLDIDRFKLINDSLGHSFGDRVLAAVTKRLCTCVRPEDIIARYGGDEFAVLLEQVQGLEEATAVADRIHEELARAFDIDGRDVFSTASIGIVMDRVQHYQEPDDLLRDADTAMYRAKAAGKAGYVVFDEGMHAQAQTNLQLETELRHALQRNEFRVYFQPIIELGSGRLTGFEALVRWAHPSRGLVAPEHFLPVAEDTGLIMPLGWWVMETACTYLAQWRKRYKFLRERVTVSVNIANRQFAHWVLPQRVQRMLETVGLPPASLCLEITETVFMANPDLAIETINRLRAIGVSLQMDDFGTGYSSLSALRTFKLNTLKIDRSFISGIIRNRSDRAIVRTVTVLAADLGMDVVAEGIETAQQLELLRALGCRRGQGYYFSAPLAASEVRRYLKALAPAGPEARVAATKQ